MLTQSGITQEPSTITMPNKEDELCMSTVERNKTQKSTHCVILLPHSTKQGGWSLLLAGSAGLPWGRGDPGTLGAGLGCSSAGCWRHAVQFSRSCAASFKHLILQ